MSPSALLALVNFPGVPYAVRAVACLVHTHPNPVVVARLFTAQNLYGGLADLLQPTANRWCNGEAAPATDGTAGALGDKGVLLLAESPGCYTQRCWTPRVRGEPQPGNRAGWWTCSGPP